MQIKGPLKLSFISVFFFPATLFSQPFLLEKHLSLPIKDMYWSGGQQPFYQSNLFLIPDSLTAIVSAGFSFNPIADFSNSNFSFTSKTNTQRVNIGYKLSPSLFLQAGVNNYKNKNTLNWNESGVSLNYEDEKYPLGLTFGPGPFMSFGEYYFWVQMTLLDAKSRNMETLFRVGKNKLFDLEISYHTDVLKEKILVKDDVLDDLSPLKAFYSTNNRLWNMYYHLKLPLLSMKTLAKSFFSSPHRPGTTYWMADSTESYEVGLLFQGTESAIKKIYVSNNLGWGETRTMGLRSGVEDEIGRYHLHPVRFNWNRFRLGYEKDFGVKEFHSMDFGGGHYYYTNSGGIPLTSSRNGISFMNYERFNPQWYGAAGLSAVSNFEFVEHTFNWEYYDIQLGYHFKKPNWGVYIFVPSSYHQFEFDYNWKSVDDVISQSKTVHTKTGKGYLESWRSSVGLQSRLQINMFELKAKLQYSFPLKTNVQYSYSGVTENRDETNLDDGKKAEMLKNGLYLALYSKIAF